jgi:outer membrane lipoprotein-sorting protein
LIHLFLPVLALAFAADPLAGILGKMDANSAAFKSARADLKRITHVASVDVNTEAIGTMLLKRPAPHDVRALITFTEPAQQVYIGNGIAQIYYPKLQTIQEYKLGGKYQAAFEQFYVLAFGGSGKDLVQNYDISYVGSEALDDVKTSHLQLLPKIPDVRKSVTKLDLWLTESDVSPAQLRLSQPSGDTTTFVYSNVKLNPKISDSDP